MEKTVVIMIGLPGSGKSTRVRELQSVGKQTVVCSTDDFFMVDGVYMFDPGKLVQNHALNFQKFALALASGIEQVIVDNTNLLPEHREPYIKLARAIGYVVRFEIVGEFTDEACECYSARNAHGVPLNSIKRMASIVKLPNDI